MMIFITGGVRSGKSHYAELRAIEMYKKNNENLHYVATGRVYDEEMRKRVVQHERVRQQSGYPWQVHENERDLMTLLPKFQMGDVVLLDCVTTLVSNELFIFTDAGEIKWRDRFFQIEVERKLKQLFTAVAEAPWTAIIVSNEIFFEFVFEDADTEMYKRMVGKVNEYIVSLATEAIVVECGLPRWKKGEQLCTE